MNYTKEFLSYHDQIQLMKSRGIKFNKISEKDAMKKISMINYYKLSGYMKNFEIYTDKYDVEFEEIIKMYEFDRVFSRIIFEMIEKIEIAFKTNLSYYLSEHIKLKGLDSFGYLDIEEWVNLNDKKYTGKHKILEEKLKFKSRITDYTARNVKGCIENYFYKYKKEDFVPLWILIEVIDFGMASTMYNDSIHDIQKKVSAVLNIPIAKDFKFYIKSLKLIRNTVAHNGILWNFKLINCIKKPLVTQYTDIKEDSIVAVMVVIVEILKAVDGAYNYTELKKLISEYFGENLKFLDKFGIKNNNLNLIDSII